MTIQIPDKILYNGQDFFIAGQKGAELLKPTDFDITREMMGISTACYRGYFCKYICIDSKLFLRELSIVQNEEVKLPLVEGVSAKPDGIGLFNYYLNLEIPCPFSGGLIIVQNPLKENVSSFSSPIEFDKVIEVLFEQGVLQQEIDHSVTVDSSRKIIDDLRRSLESNQELSNVIRKWDSPLEKISDQEKEMFHEYIDKIVNKTAEIEWSFVSNYEQRPYWGKSNT